MYRIVWLVLAYLCWQTAAQAAPAQDAHGDGARLLTLASKENEVYPKISPDGKYLLTLTLQGHNAVIARRSADSGMYLNAVTDDIASFASFNWFEDQVTFSSTRTGDLSLWKKPANGEGLMRREIELTGKLQDITLLPDGSVIATRLARGYKQKHGFSSDRFNNWDVGTLHSYIVHIFPDGSEKRLSEGVGAAVSADGRQVVFAINMGRGQHLFMMDVDGSNLAQLTTGHVVDAQPAWSPDGRWVVFTSNREGKADADVSYKNNWDIWAIATDGTHLTRLTTNQARDGAPSVGVDGVVYFHSDRRIPKEVLKAREIRGSASGFHIWTIGLPEEAVKQ